MFTVMVETEFFAEHQLLMPDGNKESLHGHSWKITAAVACETLDSAGLAMDFHQLKGILDKIIRPFIGRRLEDCEPFGRVNASAENVARYIFDRLAGQIKPPVQVCWVEITEAEGCKVRYEL
jgi:6-pyruvoyltetrahydropterin/6-carboxytetrahydropterin synthase